MQKDKILAICEHFNLGHPINDKINPVSGGLLHRMWQIETTTGIFAIKELDAEIMQRDGSHKRYNYTESFARYAKNNGILASVALSVNNSHLYELNGITVMVYPWIVGHSLESQQITNEQAYQIGMTLGKIHELHSNNPAKPDELYEISKFTNEHWKSIIKSILKHNLICSNLLERHLPDLIQWNNRYQPNQDTWFVISHRDIDPKNVLWQDKLSPILIDWESVGYINSTEDLLTVALNWGSLDLRFNIDNYLAVVKGYYASGRIIDATQVEQAFNNIIGNMLSWLEYNISRAIKSESYSMDTLKISVQEINKTLGTMHFVAAHQHEFINAILSLNSRIKD